MWYIGEIIISKNNNLKNNLLKFSFLQKRYFWQKNYRPLKQSEQIDSLIHDNTFLDEKPKMLINMKGWKINNLKLVAPQSQ